jgi:acyl-CoA reductase-like NAD-dependent aldehyde dehydrogenase
MRQQKKLTIGHWSENPFMGPLINAAAVEKYVRFQEIASREGAERLMRGKALDVSRKGLLCHTVDLHRRSLSRGIGLSKVRDIRA